MINERVSAVAGVRVARLIIIKGPDEGKQFELGDEPSGIGRDRSNRICLHDTEISRRHAEIISTKKGFVLRDVGSANGTLVNTQQVKEVQLQPGDHIQIGQSILVFAAQRNDSTQQTDLADKIRLVTRQEKDIASAIVKKISDTAGSQIMARPDLAATEWLRIRLANLSVMYETIQAVSHILDLDTLLEKIMELILKSIDADHGCIMLIDSETGNYIPKALRYRDGLNVKEKMAVSRTIVDYVMEAKEGVLIADAAKDERFMGGQSITRFNIKEAICVPMKGRHETVGVLFLDTQTTAQEIAKSGKEDPHKFTEDHLTLASAIAHQAALAVEETRYHQALVHSERLAAIGQTIAALSHHIKNIMQGIIFGSDMVRAAIAEKDDGLLQKGWKLVERNQGKIHDLVLDMLSYSKDREPAIDMLDLNSLVTEVVEVVRGRIQEEKVNLDLRLAPHLTAVPADEEGIHRALLNIVSNAIDAMHHVEDRYLGVQTLLETGGEWVRIVVLDHGTGIPPDQINHIFKPFVSTKGAKGTGLGLAVSRKILREHGGDILVQSQVGKGSKFVLRLPMKSPHLSEASGTMDMKALQFPESV
jgi:signal transduction histidine kinase/pSer/pThr/pTyr-binding forkhead associated (FHA) protein